MPSAPVPAETRRVPTPQSHRRALRRQRQYLGPRLRSGYAGATPGAVPSGAGYAGSDGRRGTCGRADDLSVGPFRRLVLYAGGDARPTNVTADTAADRAHRYGSLSAVSAVRVTLGVSITSGCSDIGSPMRIAFLPSRRSSNSRPTTSARQPGPGAAVRQPHRGQCERESGRGRRWGCRPGSRLIAIAGRCSPGPTRETGRAWPTAAATHGTGGRTKSFSGVSNPRRMHSEISGT